MTFLTIASLIILAFFPVTEQVQNKNYVLTGKVVTVQGDPISNAIIGWDYIENGERSCIMEGTRSDNEGNFSLQFPTLMRLIPIRLFATSSIPERSTALLLPPFITQPEWFLKRYATNQILLDNQANFIIGSIPVKMVFVPVTVTIVDKKGKPRLTSLEQWWAKAVIRLLDNQGRVINASTISEQDILIKKTVDLAKSEISVALPEGNWRIEVSISGFKGNFYGRSVHVRSNAKKQDLKIEIPE
jgi:hypothetical protein